MQSRLMPRWLVAAGALLLTALAPMPLLAALASGVQTAVEPAGDSDRASETADLLAQHPPVDEATRSAGMAVYDAHCAACHAGGVARAPSTTALSQLAPEAVLQALTSGAMREQAASLSDSQKQAVAQALTNRPLGQAAVPPLRCTAGDGWFDLSQPPVHEGWGLDAGNGHSMTTAQAGISRANVGQLHLQWALAFPGVINARSQPALAGGAMFVGSDNGTVYALDRQTGCAHWTFEAAGPVRTGIVVAGWQAGQAAAGAPLLYFGDQVGNAYALDARTGSLVWQRKMDEHPFAIVTGAPALAGDQLIVPISSGEEGSAANPLYECCTFRGSLVALDARTGTEVWRRYLVDPARPDGVNDSGADRFGPSGVPVWSTPLVDAARGQVIVTTGDNYSEPATALSDALIAFDLATGDIRWSWQATEGDAWNLSCGWVEAGNCPASDGPDFDFGAAPVLAFGDDGREYVLAGQKSGEVRALDPATGAVRWTRRVGRGGALGGIHFGIAAMNGRLYAPISDFPDGGEHDIPAAPGLYALDVATGEPVWSAPSADVCDGQRFCQPGYSAAITVTDQLVLAGSTDARMRIYDADSGAMLWEFNTDRTFDTVNGFSAHGGSMSGGSAPIADDGQLIVSSGYGFLGKMPGNVLLVFAAD